MFTLDEPYTHVEEIKKSRFIAQAVRVQSPEEAKARAAELRDLEANHNCYAYKIAESYRFSDDGEPGGTGGRPILSAIEGRNMDQTLVVVTRFFGGIKLGAGGLVRAYGGTASKCLHNAKKKELRPRTIIELIAPFDATGPVYGLLESYGATKLAENFAEQGIQLTLELDAQDLENFTADLIDATRGQIRFQQR